MKICYFNQEFLPTKGGIATLIGNLVVDVIRDSRVEKVTSISFYNPETKYEKRGKLEIINYRENNFIKIFFLVLKHFWRCRDYDVFQITYLFPMGIFVLPLGKIFRKKVFVNIYGMDVLTKEGSKKTKYLKKIIMKYSDKILSVSESTALLASSKYGIPLDKFIVIYPSLNNNSPEDNLVNIRSDHFLSEEDFVVLTVCRMVKRKGVDDIIKALSLINDKRIKFLVVGEGPELGDFKKLTNELGLEDRVIFVGKVENVANYYFSSDLFIMPSKFLEEHGDIEGLGIVFIEAQYFSKPVIGTNSGGIPEAILDNQTGFIVPENNPSVIAEKIEFLKNNIDVYESFSKKAKIFVKDKFDCDRIIKRLVDLYEKS